MRERKVDDYWLNEMDGTGDGLSEWVSAPHTGMDNQHERAHTWIPTNDMVYHGLRAYGYHKLASLVAQTTHDLVVCSVNREYYDAETGEGCGLDPFWDWTLLAHFVPYEKGSTLDITAVGKD